MCAFCKAADKLDSVPKEWMLVKRIHGVLIDCVVGAVVDPKEKKLVFRIEADPSSGKEISESIAISFCPKCGRKL